jgi:hypothetical protein
MKSKNRNVDKKKNDIEYYYSLINPGIEESFTYEQSKEVRRIIIKAVKIPTAKIIDIRFPLWFFRKLYVVLFIGRDIRTRERISRSFSARFISYAALFFLGLIEFIIIVFLISSILYFAKSIMGIDLFPDKHLSDFIKEFWDYITTL